MPIPPASWESATPVYGIRYPLPTAPAKHLPEAFEHSAVDVEQTLLAADTVPPGLAYVTGTQAERLAATPTRDLIWVETDSEDHAQYIGTGTEWILLAVGGGGGGGGSGLVESYMAEAVDVPNGVTTGGNIVPFGGALSGTTGLVTVSTDKTTLTVNKGGLWRVDAKAQLDINAAGWGSMLVQVDGSTWLPSYSIGPTATAGDWTGFTTVVLDKPVGTTFKMKVTASATGTVKVCSFIRLTYLGALAPAMIP